MADVLIYPVETCFHYNFFAEYESNLSQNYTENILNKKT